MNCIYTLMLLLCCCGQGRHEFDQEEDQLHSGDLHGRFAAVNGGVHTRPCRTKCEDVLLRVPKIHYFCIRYREMSIPMALSSEIFIDETLKKLIFKEKRLDYIGRLHLITVND